MLILERWVISASDQCCSNMILFEGVIDYYSIRMIVPLICNHYRGPECPKSAEAFYDIVYL